MQLNCVVVCALSALHSRPMSWMILVALSLFAFWWLVIAFGAIPGLILLALLYGAARLLGKLVGHPNDAYRIEREPIAKRD